MMRRIFIASLLAAFTLQAELPPQAYRKWQMQAPEALEIEVVKVTPVVAMKTTSVEVDAVVTKVIRTASRIDMVHGTGRLKPGSKIHITYMHEVYDRPIAGPSPIPLLHAGEKVPAFLRQVGPGTYEPVAGGRSFSALIPE